MHTTTQLAGDVIRDGAPAARVAHAALFAAALASPLPASPPQEPEAPAGAATQEQIDHAIDRGLDFILSRQALDGSWSADEHRYIAGQTGLCVYTLLKGGLPADLDEVWLRKSFAVTRAMAGGEL